MIALGDTLLSEDILTHHFVCHLDKCKGNCCVGGDRGAPLNAEDLAGIEKNLAQIRPFMNDAGRENLDRNGYAIMDEDGEMVTTCIPEGECTFVFYEDGIASCAIEKAYKSGKSDYLKPVSCHLYPIRVARYGIYDALNYHRWDICSPACTLGNKLKVPIYKFVKDALIRRFGEDWYHELEAIAAQWPLKQ